MEDPTWLINELTAIVDKGINYDPSHRHSVQQLILRNAVDSYTVVYRDGQLLAGLGTRPNFNIPTVGNTYNIGVRGFRIPQESLRQDYFVLNTIVPVQIERARNMGYEKCSMCFTNERLKNNLDKYWVYSRESTGPHLINQEMQWVYLFDTNA